MLTIPVKKYVLAEIAGGLTSSGGYLTEGRTLGLSSTTPTAEGGLPSNCNFTEPSASAGYARVNIYSSSSGQVVYPFEWVSTTGPDAYTEVQNKYEVHFNVATANWGDPLTYVGIFDSSNRLIAYGPIVDSQGEPTSITVNQGHIPTIAVGQAKISLDVQ